MNNTEASNRQTPLHLALQGYKWPSIIQPLRVAHYRSLIENHLSDLNTKNTQGCSPLHLAVSRGDAAICKLLLKKRADVNATNQEGLTPLQIACDTCKNPTVWRLLIDYGACVDSKSRMFITQLFHTIPDIHYFFIQRPELNIPQIFYGRRFLSLSEASCKFANKPLFLLNIAAHEKMGPDYGAIGKYFNDQNFTPCSQVYQEFAKNFTVVRVLVNNVAQLVPVFDKVMKFFPKIPCLHWALNGHGDRHSIGLGQYSIFNADHRHIMQQIAKRVGDVHNRGTISLWGCCNGKSGPQSEDNIAQAFSEMSPGAIVFASPEPVTTVTIRVIPSSKTKGDFLPIIFFEDEKFTVKAYRNGQLIADGELNPRTSRL